MSIPDQQYFARPGVIELGWGHPDPAWLPSGSLAAAAANLLQQDGPLALGYGYEQGPGRLIAALRAHMLGSDGWAPPAEQIAISGGISQALDHLCTLFTRPGQVALVQAPCYHLAQRILRDRGLRLVPVASDDDGIIPEQVAAQLAALRAANHEVALLYTIPSFANPHGRTLPAARRAALAALAEAEDLLIVEDEAYRELFFAAPPPPPIATFGPAAPVVRLGSFSKILAPGLRCGWLIAALPVIERWRLSGMLDSGGGVNHFSACLVAEWLAQNDLQAHLQQLRARLAERSQILFNALRQAAPRCTISVPQGGYFCWVGLPPGHDAQRLAPLAEARGLGYLPGGRFFPDSADGNQWLRLAFSRQSPADLVAAAQILGALLATPKA